MDGLYQRRWACCPDRPTWPGPIAIR